MTLPNELPRSVQTSWHGFLETYESLRPELYRYCRHLTRSPWDAEDLAQDTLARAFVTLGQMGDAPPNPRAWLFRVASNLWIDLIRRRRREEPLTSDVPDTFATSDPRGAREAAGTLLGQLSPQERAAVVLKDAFDLSLEEISEALTTTVGAIKTALHRARGKLAEPAPEPPPAPAPAVLDAFCSAFNAGDLERLTALLLDSTTVEVVGATTQYGKEAARRTVLHGMLFGVQAVLAGEVPCGVDESFFGDVVRGTPRVEARPYRGGWVLLHWYRHRDGEAVRALTRLEPDGDQIAHLRNYFYNTALIAEVCGELGVPSRSNGTRWWMPKSQS
jgi:RNA polymerase sigma-70 factor (ECF subfamily)